jgi:hypothetical protein
MFGIFCPSLQPVFDRLLTPNLARDVADHSKLCPLLVLSEDIAFLSRGEAALRR